MAIPSWPVGTTINCVVGVQYRMLSSIGYLAGAGSGKQPNGSLTNQGPSAGGANMSAVIKLATEDDIQLLLPFVRSFHEFEGLNLTDDEREISVRGLLTKSEFGGIWIIFDGALPAGYIAICKGYSIEFCGYDAFIDEFYIRPESRGKGLGMTVLQLAKVEAQKLGIRALHLEVARSNTRARSFYASASFVVRDEYSLMSVDLD